jgi:hypothetical protein
MLRKTWAKNIELKKPSPGEPAEISGWQVYLGTDLKAVLPDSGRFKSGTLTLTPELMELLRVRLAVIDQIAALEFNPNPDENDLLNLMLALPEVERKVQQSEMGLN